MARFTFPRDAAQAQDGFQGGTAATVIVVTTDQAGQVLADIQTLAGASIAGSTLNLTATGAVPSFLGPDTVTTLYAYQQGDPTRGTVRLTEVTAAATNVGESVSTGVAGVATSLNAVAASATGAVLDAGSPHQVATLQVTLASTTPPTTISTQLQGSLDNVNWFNLGVATTTATNGTTAVSVTGMAARYFRATTAITGGTGVALTALIGIAA